MEHAAALVERYFSTLAGELVVGDVPVSEIVAYYGTPLFIYDQSILDRKWALLREAMPDEFDIYYSVKANPNLTLLRYFLRRGCGLEIASGGEFYQALRAGCSAGKMVFAGPGKTDDELELVLPLGIGEIHVESLGEVERLSAVCHRLSLPSRVALRVNPGSEAQGGAMRMGGKPAPFGIDEEDLDGVVERIQSDALVELCGIHLFVGTQILEPTILAHQYRQGIAIARRIATELRRPLQTIDFGGGFGIPYFDHEHELDTTWLREELAVLMAELRHDPMFAGTRYLVEPGRFLVGEAGLYVAQIIDIKVSRGKTFLIVDGGMHHHLAASGNLGQVIKRNFPLAILNKLDGPRDQTVDVVGPLCTPLDSLARSVTLPKADVGDLVGIFQSGAYARTASPLGFLSHPSPPEVWAENGRNILIRRRGTYADLVQDQSPLFPV